MSDDLTWSRHISEVAGKANQTLGFLWQNFKQCTKEVKTATYTTIARPVLDYNHPLYGIRVTKETSRSSSKYNRAARYVYNDHTTRIPGCVTAMAKDIVLESLEDRRSIARLSLLYKMQHGLVDVDTSSYLQQGDSRTRGRRGFFQERINNEVYFNSFFPSTIREWNTCQETLQPLPPWNSSGRV